MLFADSVARSYGPLEVLTDVTFSVGKGERVGLVGPNGAGKTTLLRILAGEDADFEGLGGWKGGDPPGYLRQEASLDEGLMLLDEMWTAFPRARAVDHRLAEIVSELEGGDADIDRLVEEQAEMFAEFERLDGYRIESRIGRAPQGLGFQPADHHKRLRRLQRWLADAHRPCESAGPASENMLLDEPTNHPTGPRRNGWRKTCWSTGVVC
jgi:ATP-binding cassette subfamily F protein 3